MSFTSTATVDNYADPESVPDGTWQDWTPTLTASTTSPTLSTDSSHIYEGRYSQVGDLVFFRGQIRVGTTGVNAGSGYYLIALPVTARLPTNSASLGGFMSGQWAYFDSSTSTNYGGGIVASFTGSDGDHAALAFADSAGTAIVNGTTIANVLMGAANPVAIAASDEFEFWGFYEAA